MKKLLTFLIFIIFYFLPAQKNIQDSTITYTYSPKAFKIIEKVRQNKNNNSSNKLNAYKQTFYNKFYVDNLVYNHSKNIDSVAIPSPRGSNLIYLEEQITKKYYSKKYGTKYSTEVMKTSGLKSYFEDLTSEKVFNHDFPKVLEDKSGLMSFMLVDSITLDNKYVYVLNFWSNKNLLINGSIGALYIDTHSFSVVKYTGTEYSTDYTSYFEYNWNIEDSVRYLKNKTYKIRLATFSGFSEAKNPDFTPWLVIQSNTVEFKPLKRINPYLIKGAEYELKRGYTVNTENRIATYRTTELNDMEKNFSQNSITYNNLNRLNLLQSLKKGYIPLGKVDVDLLNLLSFNDYEGFRFQAGIKTNTNLSKDYSIYGYGAWATKDYTFKGGAGVDIKINKKYDGSLGFNFASDVNPFSKEIIRTSNNINLLKQEFNYIQNNVFYSYWGGNLYYKQDFLRKLTAGIVIDYQAQKSEYNYSYNNYSTDHTFNSFTASIRLKYAPFAKYLITPEGKTTVQDKPIHLYFNYTKGLKELKGSFDYHKFDIGADLTIKHRLGKSSINTNAGYITGKTTLWNLYGNMGNAKNSDSFLKRFSIKGFNSFETMLPGNYFADKYVAFFITHQFPEFNIWKTQKSSVALVYNGMIGNLKNKEMHSLPTSLTTPNKYYQETGIELNNLLSYLGVGLYYRVGSYHKGSIEDNLYLKLKLSIL